MGRPVVDSNVLIDYLLGHPQAIAELGARGPLAISIITWIEVMSGGPSEEERATRDFLDRFELLPLNAEIAAEAAFLRRERGRLKLPDAVIWATARVSGGDLITRNTRDFPAQDDGVVIPYQL